MTKKKKKMKKYNDAVKCLMGDDYEKKYKKRKKKKYKKRKKKKYSGPWDELDDDDYIPLPAVIPEDSVPVAFEKRLTNNAQNIREGNSIPEKMVLDPLKDGGFHFGIKKCWGNGHYIGKPQRKDGHILIVGGPGSHKTSGNIIPTFETWQGHIVVIDVKPKGDLLYECEQMSQPMGKPILIFNPHSEDSFCFEPFAFLVADGTPNLARNSKDLAKTLVALMPANDDSVWVKAAQNLLAGVIALHVGMESTFSKAMKTLQLSNVDNLIDAINGSNNDTAKMFVSKLRGLKPETLAGVGMDLTDLAILAADPRIESVLSPGEHSLGVIDWNLLNTATEPVNIVLQIPEEDLDVWTPMTTLLINQLIRTLQRRPEKFSTEGEALPPVLIILDEFASLGRIASIKAGLATLRSRGVTFSLVIQSLAQLDEIYTPIGRRVIFDICPYKVILNVTDPESQKYFSDMIGTLVVSKQSVSTTYDPATDKATSYSLTVNESREPIVHPHEFATLKDVVLMTPDGYCRIDKAPYWDKSPLVESVEAIIIQ